MAVREISAADVLPLCPYPRYVSGMWRLASMDQAIATGQAPGANSIRLYPFYVYDAVTIDQLGVYCGTLSAGGNVQIAIYAADATTLNPTGTALVSTASIDASGTGSLSAAASLALAPGIYWAATNCDNATNSFGANGSTSTWMSRAIGSATQSSCLSGGGGTLSGYTFAQTFGTWPNLTGQTFAELTTSQRIPIIQYRVA